LVLKNFKFNTNKAGKVKNLFLRRFCFFVRTEKKYMPIFALLSKSGQKGNINFKVKSIKKEKSL